jgi:hypothetical protein
MARLQFPKEPEISQRIRLYSGQPAAGYMGAAGSRGMQIPATRQDSLLVTGDKYMHMQTTMKPLYLLAIGLALAGCQSMATDDRNSIWFKMPAGSTLVLNRELTIPAQRAHIMLQHGQVVSAASEFEVACRFEVRDLGPRVIQPETFQITGYSSQQEWINYPHTKRFYKTIRLQSEHQPGIRPMVCEYFDWPLTGRPVTLVQIEEALGEYFSFMLPE